jgi:hypothetical protein
VSGVGRIIRAEIYAHIGLDELDPNSDFIRQATRDVVVARELMPRSPYVYALAMLVHWCGVEYHQALGQTERAAVQRQLGDECFEERPNFEDFAIANGLAATYLEGVGRAADAEKQYLQIGLQETGIWKVQHALFLVRQNRAEEALELLNKIDTGEAWQGIVTAMTILAATGGKNRSKESLAVINDLPNTMDEQLYPLALGIACLGGNDVDEIKASWISSMWEKSRGDNASFALDASLYFFDRQMDEAKLREKAITPEEKCLANFCVAMRAYEEGSTELAAQALSEALQHPTTGPTHLLARHIPFVVRGD